MDDLGFNKIAAAVLATTLGYLFIRELPHFVMHEGELSVPAYSLVLPEMNEEQAVQEEPFPSALWLTSMDVTRGAKVFKKCQSCHNTESGGRNGTGPNLWDIVGHKAARRAGFNYSSALAGADLTWNYETLDGFLTKPRTYLPSTNMNFIGLKKPQDRAAVIAFLREQSDTPMPLPQ